MMLSLIRVLLVAQLITSKPQQIDVKQSIEIVCSACVQRLEKEPGLCCTCIDQEATCNNDIAEKIGRDTPGATCIQQLDCPTFGDCSDSCNEIFDETLISVKQAPADRCPSGQKVCCNAIDNEIFGSEDTCVNENEEGSVQGQKTLAIQDFSHGVTCGKRDSRVYYNAGLPDTYTNPGEWPWAVLIYDGNTYVGAGALVDNLVVVTVAHKMREYERNPSGLVVRLGDWNPNNENDEKENFDHVEMSVDCVKIHPNADLNGTLANNVAVLRLRVKEDVNVVDVITLFSGDNAPQRPGNRPEGVEGFNRIQGADSIIDTRLGILNPQDPLAASDDDVNLPMSYINTVCLPRFETQFEGYDKRCWVSSWGTNQQRQREVDLPLLSRSECIRKLRGEFNSRNVPNWSPQSSEICAGGEPNSPDKDTCRGEGGAPLVCYDPRSDQFFLLGLVGYGFDCKNGLPGVYTNMADRGIQQFVESAMGQESNFCSQ